MDCSRRTFLKGLFGASIVAIAVPKSLADGRYVVKLEKRFKPGEFVYVEYGKHVPIHVLTEEEANAALIAEDITWDGSDEAIARRVNFMKDLMISLYEIEDVSQFDKSLEGLFSFVIALESAFESAYILLEFMDIGRINPMPEDRGIPRIVREKLADHLLKNPKFVDWRKYHTNKLRNAHILGKRTIQVRSWCSDKTFEEEVPLYEEEDMNLFKEMVHSPRNFGDLLFNEKEIRHIASVISQPTHWLHS